MKIGFCAKTVKDIKAVYNAGYDFVEVCNWAICDLSEEQFMEYIALKDELPDGFMYACNGLLPADIRITGDTADHSALARFCEKSFRRLKELGVKMLVFGSARAKNVPEGFSFDVALEQIKAAVTIMGNIAAKNGLSLCIEPLGCHEANIVNLAEDSVSLAKNVNMSNVGGHVDYFHLMQNGEKMSKLEGLAKEIFHTHIASPCKRTTVTVDDGADYGQFFRYLRKGGYDKTVSFEGKCDMQTETLEEMCSYLKSL